MMTNLDIFVLCHNELMDVNQCRQHLVSEGSSGWFLSLFDTTPVVLYNFPHLLDNMTFQAHLVHSLP